MKKSDVGSQVKIKKKIKNHTTQVSELRPKDV